uniref:C-type lectin domain-containing protein n=1 Tax=Myotis lucifugus TaxID=59463 RepID=G1NXU0_MYOLU
MSMKYEDLQSLESEKKSQGSRKGKRKGIMVSPKKDFCWLPPPPAFLQHLCSGPWPLLLSLGLILLLMIGICVIGSKNARIQSDVETLRATFSNFTSNTMAEVQALHSQGGSLQTTITSLKAVVEKQEQELQAARSLNDKVFSLKSKLEKEQQELKADYSEMLLGVQQLVKDLNTLHCQMAALKSNDSQNTCCPIGWLEYEGSCYWFSRSGLTWPQAEKHCQLEDAHLVVVGSWKEQKFLQQHMYPVDTWIGLNDQNGPWTWVDGTDYKTGFQVCALYSVPLVWILLSLLCFFEDPHLSAFLRNWSPRQPDNWYHGQEDCAHFRANGQWNDNLCVMPFHWICETELNRSSS